MNKIAVIVGKNQQKSLIIFGNNKYYLLSLSLQQTSKPYYGC